MSEFWRRLYNPPELEGRETQEGRFKKILGRFYRPPELESGERLRSPITRWMQERGVDQLGWSILNTGKVSALAMIGVALIGGVKLGETWKKYGKDELYSWQGLKKQFNMAKGNLQSAARSIGG